MKKIILIINVLIISLLSNAQTPNFIWAVNLNGAGSASGNSIITDAFGNVYTVGSFDGVVDFDPGLAVQNFSGLGTSDVFISKLDASGNFIWTKTIGAVSQKCFGNTIVINSSGDLYITGSFDGIVDFDPGAGVYNLNGTGSNDGYILKLDASGNFVWAKAFIGMLDTFAGDEQFDASGNIYLTGFFNGTSDFDPSASTFSLSSVGNFDAFIVKIDALGNFIWVKQLAGTANTIISSIKIDGLGNICTTGYFNGITDFDPGIATASLSPQNNADDIFILKLDPSGNFLWAKSFIGISTDRALDLAIDASNNIYSTGGFGSTVDFDPGPGTFNLTAPFNLPGGITDVFVSKLDPSGNFIWAKQITGNMDEAAYSIDIDLQGNIYIGGSFSGTGD